MAGDAFTIKHKGIVSRLLTETMVLATTAEHISKKYIGLWDTGATGSCISQRIVDELKLVAVTRREIITPSGKSESDFYPISIVLPNGVGVKLIIAPVGEFEIQGFDMLIGMDVITLGDFAVTHFNNETTLSFRTPSMTCIDFVKKSYIDPKINDCDKVGRNELCQCGSGKKHKHCCGKRQ